MHLAVAVDGTALQPGLLDLARQVLVRDATSRLGLVLPSVITAGVHLQYVAQRTHCMLLLVIPDERVPHPDPLAKYAAAFFKTSRSSVTRFNSASNRLSLAVWSS